MMKNENKRYKYLDGNYKVVKRLTGWCIYSMFKMQFVKPEFFDFGELKYLDNNSFYFYEVNEKTGVYSYRVRKRDKYRKKKTGGVIGW
jgi:hypothetical protein